MSTAPDRLYMLRRRGYSHDGEIKAAIVVAESPGHARVALSEETGDMRWCDDCCTIWIELDLSQRGVQQVVHDGNSWIDRALERDLAQLRAGGVDVPDRLTAERMH